jgi:capsular exopolysaccharide synthesis family protein
MDLRQYLQAIYKHRWILAAGLLVGLLLGSYTVMTSETTYRGSVTFFVSSAGEGTVSSANVGDQFALRRVNSYLALLETDRLAEMVVDDSGLDTTAAFVSSRISGTADIDTVLLRAVVSHEKRDVALVITESLSRQFVELVNDVERPASGEATVRLEVVSGPSVSPVGVRWKMILASRAMAGLVIAAAIALVRELTDNRLHSIEQMQTAANAPLLGLIPHDRRASHTPLILSDGLRSARSEAYRQLRTNLQFVDTADGAKVIMVTSSIPGEGKSTTAANLAIALAQSGKSVVVVDADLRKPTIGNLFNFEQAVGLTEVLLGQVSVDDVSYRWGKSPLVVLPSGTPPPNPSELLGTVGTRRLIAELRNKYDIVVIDSPPLVPVTDAAVISTLVDGVVLIVRPGKVTKAQFNRAIGQLERVGARLLGLVGSMLSDRSEGTYGRYYGEGDEDREIVQGGQHAATLAPPTQTAHPATRA